VYFSGPGDEAAAHEIQPDLANQDCSLILKSLPHVRFPMNWIRGLCTVDARRTGVTRIVSDFGG